MLFPFFCLNVFILFLLGENGGGEEFFLRNLKMALTKKKG